MQSLEIKIFNKGCDGIRTLTGIHLSFCHSSDFQKRTNGSKQNSLDSQHSDSSDGFRTHNLKLRFICLLRSQCTMHGRPNATWIGVFSLRLVIMQESDYALALVN